ncbi:MAG: hypothetical protein DMH00_04185 [Acidobacteria bacterium]|nr:MAG: hypothetical protein DMH00_04185 [Acidobacteriota bacterium]
MQSRILAFPAPRTPVFRRSGPLRWIAALILLLFSAAVVAITVGAGTPGFRAPRNPVQPETAGGPR